MATEESAAPLRDVKDVLIEALLVAMPSKDVYEWLEKEASRSERWATHDVAVEQCLLAKQDPLIDLALARFGQHESVSRLLFERRGTFAVAALSNKILPAKEWDWPERLLFSDEQAFRGWVRDASEIELRALFENPSLPNDVLSDLLEFKQPWAELSDHRRLIAVDALARNNRLAVTYSGPADGWAEYTHDRVFDLLWNLASSVPVSDNWAHVLASALGKSLPIGTSLKNPLKTAERWQGTAWAFSEVRTQLGRLAVRREYRNDFKTFLAHEDPAVRAAAYRYGRLSPEEILTAFERDPETAQEDLTSNHSNWRNPDQRVALGEISRLRDDRDKHANLDGHNRYNAMRKEIESEHADWFVDVDEDAKAPVETDQPGLTPSATDIEVLRLLTHLQRKLEWTNVTLILLVCVALYFAMR